MPDYVQYPIAFHQPGAPAADGDVTGRIYNDPDDPQDIVLPFYNIGRNPIIGVHLNQFMAISIPKILKEGENFTVNEAGNTVTLKEEYLQTLTIRVFFGLVSYQSVSVIHTVTFTE